MSAASVDEMMVQLRVNRESVDVIEKAAVDARQ